MATDVTAPVELVYSRTGGDAPAVPLRGQGACGSNFELQLAALAEYDTIAPDLRGHGHSSTPPAPYSMAGLSADVAALYARLDRPACHLVGHSLGGCVGLSRGLLELLTNGVNS